MTGAERRATTSPLASTGGTDAGTAHGRAVLPGQADAANCAGAALPAITQESRSFYDALSLPDADKSPAGLSMNSALLDVDSGGSAA